MKKVYALLIPMLAGVSMVGGGYSIWTFGGNGATSISDTTITVTDALSDSDFGSFQVTMNNARLELLQSSNISKGDGVKFKGNLGIKFNFNSSLDVSNVSYYYDFTLKITFNNSKLFDYVDFTFNDNPVKTNLINNVFTYSFERVTYDSSSKTNLNSIGKAIYFEQEIGNNSLEKKNTTNCLVPHYINEPSTLEEYNTMINDIFPSGISESPSLFSIDASFIATPVFN